MAESCLPAPLAHAVLRAGDQGQRSMEGSEVVCAVCIAAVQDAHDSGTLTLEKVRLFINFPVIELRDKFGCSALYWSAEFCCAVEFDSWGNWRVAVLFESLNWVLIKELGGQGRLRRCRPRALESRRDSSV